MAQPGGATPERAHHTPSASIDVRDASVQRELVRGIRAGDVQAFETDFARTAPRSPDSRRA